MSEKPVTNKKAEQKLIEDLSSSMDEIVLKALTKVKDKGTVNVIEPLIDAYFSTENAKIKQEISEILNSLKISTATEALINALDENAHDRNQLILNALWNSNLDSSKHMNKIMEIAVTGDYLTAFEALTVLDNLDEIIEEEQLTECKLILNNYFGGTTDDKADILKQILILILAREEALAG